jgi:Eco29kI restriction endonuclease.
MTGPRPFNPLHKRNLAASIAEALLESEPVPLGTVPPFAGSGVYAIYYTGQHPAYTALADANRDGKWWAPIYVGKAIPQGGRKGRKSMTTTPNSPRGAPSLPA